MEIVKKMKYERRNVDIFRYPLSKFKHAIDGNDDDDDGYNKYY